MPILDWQEHLGFRSDPTHMRLLHYGIVHRMFYLVQESILHHKLDQDQFLLLNERFDHRLFLLLQLLFDGGLSYDDVHHEIHLVVQLILNKHENLHERSLHKNQL